MISIVAHSNLDAWTVLATPHWMSGPNNFHHVCRHGKWVGMGQK